MSATNPLSFKFVGIRSGRLEIEITNGAGALDQALTIEIRVKSNLLDPRVVAARAKAQVSGQPNQMASLAEVVTLSGGLSVWVYYYKDSDFVALRVVNYLDQQTGKKLAAATKVEAGAVLKLSVPLTDQGSHTRATLPYWYRHGQGEATNGSLDVTPEGGDKWQPDVVFMVDQENPTAIEPATKVVLSWKITDGVSATLRGPLPGGHSQLPLDDKPESKLKIKEGSIELYAVGPAVYFLDAVVKPPRSRTTERVVRTIMLDIKKTKQYTYMRVRPNRVLPYGQVITHWAVWGVKKVKLGIVNKTTGHTRETVTLKLTQQDTNDTYYGSGEWKEQAYNVREEVVLTLVGTNYEPKKKDIAVEAWGDLNKPGPKYTGRPRGLAVLAPHMALLTSDGLWMAYVGKDDADPDRPKEPAAPKFRKVSTDAPTTWLALTTFEDSFVVLQQTTEGNLRQEVLQLVRYGHDGKPKEGPFKLPDFFSQVVRRPGSVFDLVAYRDRLYVVAEHHLPSGSVREAVSVSYDPDPDWHSESLLGQLKNYRLLCFADGLYALNRDSGHMLRFNDPGDRELDIDEALMAARAAKGNQSLVRTGLLVPLPDVLVVLDPVAVSSFEMTELSELSNVSDFSFETPPAEQSSKVPPNDLVYNPQKNEWAPCGQGLEVKPGAVAAYRESDPPRLWVLQPGGEMSTLADPSADLFAPEFTEAGEGKKFPPAGLPPALNVSPQPEFQIENSTGVERSPSVERKPALGFDEMSSFDSGLDEVGSSGPVDVNPPPRLMIKGVGRWDKFKINYHQGDPSPIRLRFRVNDQPSPYLFYFLEVTFQGADLSCITSVFKRFGEDRSGVISIDEVPGTLTRHPAKGPIKVPHPGRLFEKVKLVICNDSAYDLGRSDQQRQTPRPFITTEMQVTRDTETFSVHPTNGPEYHRLGEIYFNINYAMPHGIEVVPSGLGQQKLIWVNPEQAPGLEVRLVKMLTGDESVEVSHRGSKTKISADKNVVYVCQIGSKR